MIPGILNTLSLYSIFLENGFVVTTKTSCPFFLKASNKAFRKMIELFDYTLQKSSDRRHELHSIAVGMINRNVTKKNFKILKKHLSVIVSRKRENNEYFEYVQNYLNEVEQKIYN